MVGLGNDSEDEVEVLDLTTPLPPASRRLCPSPTAATVGAVASSSASPAARGRNRGAGVSDGSGSDSNDDLFSMDYKPLRERLQQTASTTATTSAAGGPRANGGRTSSSSTKTSRSRPTAAASTERLRVLGCSSDEEEDGIYVGGGKGKARAKAAKEGMGGGGGGGGSSATTGTSSCGRDNEEEEEADYAACTQESQVVDLLSDSDDDEGGVAPGRSQLWSRGGAGTKATAQQASNNAGDSNDGSDDDDTSVLERNGDEDDPGAGGAAAANSPSDLDLDSLLLASQASSCVSMSSPSRPALGDDGAGARRARANEPGGGCGGGGGGRGVGSASASTAAAAAAAAADVVGVLDDSSDDDFSMDGGGGRATSSSSASRRGAITASGGSDVSVGAATVSRNEKVPAQKEPVANRKRQRQEAAAAARERKEQEKLARKREKELEKREREVAKQREKAEKAAKTKRDQQARGNFRNEEVACVMERRFFDSARNARARAGAAEQQGLKEKFMVAPGDCGAAGAIWWTRRAHLDGGAAVSGPGVQTLDILVVVVPPETLLDRLGRPGTGGRGPGDGGGGDLFRGLGQFVDGIRSSAPGFSRLVLVLEGAKAAIDKRWAASAHGSSSGTGKGPAGRCARDDEFEDAQCWLLIHKEVETRLTKNSEETGQYLWDLTKSLSSMPYKDDVTELHCVARSKTEARGSERFPEKEKELMDTWVRMLEQVQHVSGNKAVEIAAHYPLPRDLVAALSDPAVPEADRAGLLQRKMGSSSEQRKCARRVFELFTQEDGDFVID
ncbi:unnamed protein product [Ectocarpus sp. 12 AP-2014]